MGNASTTDAPVAVPNTSATDKPKCKACCACPETKKPRDEW